MLVRNWTVCSVSRNDCKGKIRYINWLNLALNMKPQSTPVETSKEDREREGLLYEFEKSEKIMLTESRIGSTVLSCKSSQSKATCWNCWWRRRWSPNYTLLHRAQAAVSQLGYHHEHTVLSAWGSSEMEQKGEQEKTKKKKNTAKIMWGGLMRRGWWKGYGEFTNTGSPTQNSQESILIERRPCFIWVEAAPAALMLGYLTVSITF